MKDILLTKIDVLFLDESSFDNFQAKTTETPKEPSKGK